MDVDNSEEGVIVLLASDDSSSSGGHEGDDSNMYSSESGEEYSSESNDSDSDDIVIEEALEELVSPVISSSITSCIAVSMDCTNRLSRNEEVDIVKKDVLHDEINPIAIEEHKHPTMDTPTTSAHDYAPESYIYSKRLHELEKDRRDLQESLLEVKERLLYSEKALEGTKEQLTTITEKHSRNIEQLQAQLLQAQIKNSELLTEKHEYITTINPTTIHTNDSLLTSSSSDSQYVLNDYLGQLRDAQEKIREYEDKDIQLLRASRTIAILERKLRSTEEEIKIVELMKKQLSDHDSMKYRNEVLEQQNKALKQRVGNVELLKYQLQTEREKTRSLEEKLSTMDGSAHSEKQGGDSNSDGESSSSSVLLKYKLLDAQQREILLTRQVGVMETNLRLANEEMKDLREKKSIVDKQLALEREDNRIKNDSIQRLERRLQFITKEREGCVNVLNSYKQDGGAESVLKEQIKELQDVLKRYEERIHELEQRNEELLSSVNSTKKQLLLANHDRITATERMVLVEDHCQQLKIQKQKFEELLKNT